MKKSLVDEMPRRSTAKERKHIKNLMAILQFVAEKPRSKQEIEQKFVKAITEKEYEKHVKQQSR